MRPRCARLALAFALLGVVPLWLAVDRPPGLGDVADVRTWSYPTYTRVVVETTRPVTTELHRLAADRSTGRPERLYFDLPDTWVGRRFPERIEIGDGLLQGVRIGQNELETARVVVDLAHYERHRVFALSSPPRLVLDVYSDSVRGSRTPSTSAPTRAPSTGVDVAARPPTVAPGASPRLPVDLRGVERVVIDAGHGGRDPGASAYGIREKDVTLDVALDLERRLRGRGFEVVMTRRTDRSVSLEERTALAEGARGDVYVSIHVNAAPRRSAHGIETYFLDASHERHTLRVASRENDVPPSGLDDLQRTLAGLRVSEIGQYSSVLARTVHGELLNGVRSTYGSTPDLGVKRGPFHVLFLSDMPSILVEVGFVTNRAEAKRLKSRFYREVLAEHLARGLSRYRNQRTTHLVSGPPPAVATR